MSRKKKDQSEEVDIPLQEFRKIHSGKVVLTRISVDMDLQVRKDGIDADTVKEYSGAIEDPLDDLPAMAAFTTAEEYNEKCALLLADGFHRITSYKQMGRTTGPVDVYFGDEHDALRFAIEANGKHGKAFTSRDRKFAIQKILSDPTMKDWSVRKIAETVNCSKSLVQLVKNPPEPKQRQKREPKAEPETPLSQPRSIDSCVNIDGSVEQERYVPEAVASAPVSDGPSVMPSVVHERKESTLATKNERLDQFASWVKEGHITRADVSNLFSNGNGNFVFVKSDLPTAKKTLIVKHGADTLIEADVTVTADLQALITVEVDDPRKVEYVYEGGPLAATA